MTDHPHDDVDARIEGLLREMSSADRELLDPPEDLWSKIEAAVADEPRESGIIRLTGLRHRRAMTIVAAAAAIIGLVLGFGIITNGGGDDSTVLASAELTFDPVNFDELGREATARVSLVDAEGVLVIDIDEAVLPDLGDEAADLELWLIQPDDQGNPVDLVSLGTIDPDELDQHHRVPASYDPGVFSVVDISVEPRDGDAGHSGHSILRGALTEA